MWWSAMSISRNHGFTLIEVMVTLAIIAILSAVALPSYTGYVQRSRVPAGLEALSSYATRMEQRYQDTGCYANTCAPVGANCALAVPAPKDFTVTCELANNGQNYTATATGSGPMNGYAYTINQTGARTTTAHPKGANNTCWTTKGGTSCDS
jgi:type IV pilus assembly protein PilE